jgi:ketosteroid isomerase-like protein
MKKIILGISLALLTNASLQARTDKNMVTKEIVVTENTYRKSADQEKITLKRTQAKEVVNSFFKAISEGKVADLEALFVADALHQDPLTAQPKNIIGSKQISDHYVGLMSDKKYQTEFEIKKMYPMSDPSYIFVEYEMMVTDVDTKEAKSQNYVSMFQVKDKKIESIQSYFNPAQSQAIADFKTMESDNCEIDLNGKKVDENCKVKANDESINTMSKVKHSVKETTKSLTETKTKVEIK